MSASMPENQAVVYSRSIKISDTVKGIRLDIHVYANDTIQSIQEAFQTYLKARQTAMDNKIPLALEEIK